MSREMKKSGVEWIGEIPEKWNVCKIDSLYFPRSTKVSDKDYPPLSVTMKGIVPQLASTAKTDDHDNRKLVKKGDFAINSRSDRRGSCGISEYDGSVSLINTVLQPRHGMNNEYYNWLFHSDMFSSEFYRLGHGIVDDLRTTSWQEMKKMVIPAPSPTAQQQIVHFLDCKCTAIDTAIEKTKKSIVKLEEYKKAVITKAVTKGINPNAKMKDSGVEWIGEIPEGWEITRNKFYVIISHGMDPKTEGDIPVYGSGAESFKTCGEYKEGPAVLLGRKGTVNIPQWIDGRYWNVDTAFDVKTKSKDIGLKYFYFLSMCFNYNYYVAKTTLPSMTQFDYCNMRIPLPSRKEQDIIVSYIEDKCVAIDTAIEKKKKAIEKLEEYKKSLIFYAVTGKIDCRNEVANVES